MNDHEQLSQLIASPTERMDVEVKQWFDPNSVDGIAKLAMGCMALYNSGGGYFIIGFRDDGSPDVSKVPPDIQQLFHADTVQGIIGKYASPPFAISVNYVERDGQTYPVIAVPSGVTSPVAAKSDLANPSTGKLLIRDHAVYVRSITANNTVSSSEARRGDWPGLINTWLDNRESDIGRFIRRNLAGMLDPTVFQTLLQAPEIGGVASDVSTQLRGVLEEGYLYFVSRAEQRGNSLPNTGYREFAVKILGDVPPHKPTESLLRGLDMAVPTHTGWPPWVVLLGSNEPKVHPYVANDAWECFLPQQDEILFGPTYDFWRIDPRGEFYHLRALEDDLAAFGSNRQAPEPKTVLDYSLQIGRSAEAISMALAMARSLGCDPESTTLAFAVRWLGLEGRQLSSWCERGRMFRPSVPCVEQERIVEFRVPLDTPLSGVADHVENAVQQLFVLFGGYELDSRAIEKITSETLTRRM